MCIRDSSKIFLESIMNDKLFPLYLAGGMSTEQFYGIDAFQKNILNGIGTVSYTHLDVYKRQELGQSHFRYFAYCCRKVSFIPKIENGILEEC